MRIPNASPCGMLSNFETRCTDFFHPNVLAYVIRNRAAHLARHMRNNQSLNSHVLGEVWQIQAAAVCASCHFRPQTAATLLLSLAKLGVIFPEAVRGLTGVFKFHNAQPKAIALTFNAFSQNPKALSHVDRSFWLQMEDTIANIAHDFLPQDVATCALSTTGILASYRHNTQDGSLDRVVMNSLTATYKQLLMHADRMLSESGSQDFNTRDLSCLLLSIYSSKVEAPKTIIATLQRLKQLIPLSLNGIDDVIGLLDMIPPPTFAASTVEERRIKRDVTRAEKSFVEWSFEYLKSYLDRLKERELARVAAACNRIRSWSQDDFVIKFANAWTTMLRQTGVLSPNILNHGLCYFMRRYEASVSRELSAQSPVDQQKIAEVSDTCARVGEMLYEHAKSHYSADDLQRVDEIIHIAEQCRAKRPYR